MHDVKLLVLPVPMQAEHKPTVETGLSLVKGRIESRDKRLCTHALAYRDLDTLRSKNESTVLLLDRAELTSPLN
jgi:hypothetical protein